MVRADRRIMAVVLTHNAPESLDRCIRSIAGQSSPPETILVVDNASAPPVRLDALPTAGLLTRLVRSDINTGPAGGYARALGEFAESGFGHAWVLDDDMHPEPECLDRLWAVAEKEPETAFVFPISRQPDGSYSWWFSWCGFIVSRQIVEAVGVPLAELFWWAEDTEYLQYRIPEHGYHHQVVERRRRQSRRDPAGRRRTDVEVLLRNPQHALCASPREASYRSVSPEHGQAAGPGGAAGEGPPVSPARGDAPGVL